MQSVLVVEKIRMTVQLQAGSKYAGKRKTILARRLDQIIVVDVESTCWQGAPPDGQESEIIQIGVCTLDVVSGEPIDKRSILVRPTQSKVSEFCTQLTGLTQKQINHDGVSFAQACRLIAHDYHARERVWASYGDYDRTQFMRQCDQRGVEYPFSPSHINVKTLFALVHALPYEVGLARAADLLQIMLQGTPHRGDDDAWNTARILARLLLEKRPQPMT